MSNAEHLIENALEELKAGHDFDSFKALWHTSVMCEQLGIEPEIVWEMACYVFVELFQNGHDYSGIESGSRSLTPFWHGEEPYEDYMK